ncbi:DHS-like NAD/FAD-binding domain-containing protein [Lineolata rhizophorae]|uniref:DHS-like NAD/FAD-binding domain-containing protein n=1 Tax=Lineolata rhizophorae TaxID=578093 RepID=A0A6A6PBR4_9PEZI|nr:DHS-like NAD/FAD-binding domain-containing protein [Lineolata rhizophorae]
MPPLMRIPYTAPLPPALTIPASARTVSGAVAALAAFLTAPPAPHLLRQGGGAGSAAGLEGRRGRGGPASGGAVLLSGAGVSVASGLADYRGQSGTYTLNKSYKPIYYSEFVNEDYARRRYWARSFLGWSTLDRARPNRAHWAVKELGEMGLVGEVITQNVDSFHPTVHPSLPTTELHGALRSVVCLSCGTHYPRSSFQRILARLNPTWAAFLADLERSGALSSEDPAHRRARGLRTNPDGDVDVPGVQYDRFAYPACPRCAGRKRGAAGAEAAGLWADELSAGGEEPYPDHHHPHRPSATLLDGPHAAVLKPAVVMFGEAIAPPVRAAADAALDRAGRLLVVGSSLATYSAWRLARRAKERGIPVGVVNLGGVRGEEAFFADVEDGADGIVERDYASQNSC